jgi:hypothetical protein
VQPEKTAPIMANAICHPLLGADAGRGKRHLIASDCGRVLVTSELGIS